MFKIGTLEKQWEFLFCILYLPSMSKRRQRLLVDLGKGTHDLNYIVWYNFRWGFTQRQWFSQVCCLQHRQPSPLADQLCLASQAHLCCPQAKQNQSCFCKISFQTSRCENSCRFPCSLLVMFMAQKTVFLLIDKSGEQICVECFLALK